MAHVIFHPADALIAMSLLVLTRALAELLASNSTATMLRNLSKTSVLSTGFEGIAKTVAPAQFGPIFYA